MIATAAYIRRAPVNLMHQRSCCAPFDANITLKPNVQITPNSAKMIYNPVYLTVENIKANESRSHRVYKPLPFFCLNEVAIYIMRLLRSGLRMLTI